MKRVIALTFGCVLVVLLAGTARMEASMAVLADEECTWGDVKCCFTPEDDRCYSRCCPRPKDDPGMAEAAKRVLRNFIKGVCATVAA